MVHAHAVHVDSLRRALSRQKILMYSTDKRVYYSFYNLVSQKDSREALNFILGYLIDYLRGLHVLIHYSSLPNNHMQKSKLLLGARDAMNS